MTAVGRSNIDNVTAFSQNLDAYENAVLQMQNPLANVEPIWQLKLALVRIIIASPNNAYTLLRVLVNRVFTKMDTCYSEATITELAGSTRDDQARQLVMSILYKALCVVRGEAVTFSSGDVTAVAGSSVIQTFLMDYPGGDPSLPVKGTSIESPADTDPWEGISASGPVYQLRMSVGRFAISLDGATVSTLQLANAPSNLPIPNTTWVAEIWLRGLSTMLILDGTIAFTEYALAQILDLGVLPAGYQPGADTKVSIQFLDTLRLSVVFDEDTQAWTVAHVEVLSPATPFPFTYIQQ
jgi:hypothetical protein